MSREEIIAEIMRQVRDATNDQALRWLVESKLARAPDAVLREIYATNAMPGMIARARARLSSSSVPNRSGDGAARAG